METRELEKEARNHVRRLKEYYVHLAVYLIVMAGLTVMNLIFTPGFFWAAFPMVGWGIGLVAHAVSTRGLFGIGGKAWEAKKTREYMLQHAGMLGPDDVLRILDEEMASRGEHASAGVDVQRLLKRVENLEAIVTSHDWETLEKTGRRLPDDLAGDSDQVVEENPEQQLRRLSRRVR